MPDAKVLFPLTILILAVLAITTPKLGNVTDLFIGQLPISSTVWHTRMQKLLIPWH